MDNDHGGEHDFYAIQTKSHRDLLCEPRQPFELARADAVDEIVMTGGRFDLDDEAAIAVDGDDIDLASG